MLNSRERRSVVSALHILETLDAWRSVLIEKQITVLLGNSDGMVWHLINSAMFVVDKIFNAQI